MRPGWALLLSAVLAIPAQAAPKIVGYATSWSGAAHEIDWTKLTHVHYAFVVPRADGTVPPVPNPGKLAQLAAAAHERSRKVLLAVGGWNDGNDSGFESLARDPAARLRFVEAMRTAVRTYGLDGVDVDWEYPEPFGDSAAGYLALLRELCAAMHAEEKLCASAVAARGPHADGVRAEVFAEVDYLTLMAYDGDSGAGHSPLSYAQAALDYWRGRGLPPEKSILGIPFYGRPSWESYRQIVARDPEAPGRDVSNGVYYNGLDTVRAKSALALERAGGVMIWELAQDTRDDTSLLGAIWSVLGEAVLAPPPLPVDR